MKKISITLLLLHALVFSLFAQQNNTLLIRSGLDSSLVSGAVVRVDKSSSVFTTDERGVVELQLSKGEYLLKITYIGHLEKAVSVMIPFLGVKTVYLTRSDQELESVTIRTGYESIKGERMVGAVSSVNESLLNRSVGSNVLDRIKDVVPGLIFNKSGNAANNPISIRGQNTIFANSQPLIILDNFPFTGDINNINPNDVESITVLKDASAASIWGARAGNGVIVITTKAGRAGSKTKFSFMINHDMGEKPDLFYRPRLSSSDFIDLEKLLFSRGYYTSIENSASKSPLTPVVELLIAKRDGKLSAEQADQQIEAFKKYELREDYQKYLSRSPLNTQMSMSLSGGEQNNNFYLGAGVDRSRLSDLGNDSKRYSFDFRENYSLLNNKLKADFIFRYSNITSHQNNSGYNAMSLISGTQMYPYARLVDDFSNPVSVTRDYREGYLNGLVSSLLDWRYVPITDINQIDNLRSADNYSAQASLRYTIIPGLDIGGLYQFANESISTSFLQGAGSYYARNMVNSYSRVNADNSVTRPIPQGGILDWGKSLARVHNLRGQISYHRNFSSDHNISVFMGMEMSDKKTLGNSTRFYGYDSEYATSIPVDYKSQFPYFYLPGSSALIQNIDNASMLSDRFVSYFLSGSYALKSKYFLNGSLRKDQSNIFGVNTNQKGVPLWSLGAAWLISDESFFNKTIFSQLKLRLTYGYNGNLDRNASAYTTASFRTGAEGTALPYAQIENPPNPELRWERISSLNAGLDFQLLNDAIDGSVDVYQKNGQDIMGRNPFAPSTGITTFYGNIASTRTQGIDMVINARANLGPVYWQGVGIYSYTRERVTEYNLKATGSVYMSTVGTPLKGKPLYGIYYYPFAKLDANNGDPIGYLNGAESKEYSRIISATNADNIQYAGSARPVHFGSFRNSLSFKEISLSANVSYRLGYYFRKPALLYGDILSAKGGHTDFLNRWKVPGDELRTTIPSLPAANSVSRDNFYQYSSEHVRSGNHIRLQDVRVEYNLEKLRLIKRMKVTNASLFMYAQNLGIIWAENKEGLDPDNLTSQSPRSIAVGLKLTL